MRGVALGEGEQVELPLCGVREPRTREAFVALVLTASNTPLSSLSPTQPLFSSPHSSLASYTHYV